MEKVRTSYSFYPRKDDPCPNVRWCPHAGGVGISSLVVLANQNEQSRDYLHRTLDAERKRLSEAVAENEKLRTELEQVKLVSESWGHPSIGEAAAMCYFEEN